AGPTYSWSVDFLPAGLSFTNSSGNSIAISGTPTTASTYNYTITVSSNGQNGSISITGFVSSSYAVTSVSPSTIPTGAGGTMVTVWGKGFTANSVINLNGNHPAGTSYLSQNALSIIIPASYFTFATTYTVTVNTSGVVTNGVNLTVGTGGGTA